MGRGLGHGMGMVRVSARMGRLQRLLEMARGFVEMVRVVIGKK